MINKALMVVGVSLFHLLLIVLLLRLSIPGPIESERETVRIEIVERAVDLPQPVTPETAVTPQPEQKPPIDRNNDAVVEAMRRPAEPQTQAASVGEAPATALEGIDLDVLSQRADDASKSDATASDTGGDIPALDEIQLADVLRLASCQKLVQARDPECPETDPFDTALTLAARKGSAANSTAIAFDIEENAYEQFFSGQKKNRHMFPGMSADMFSDPLPPGAHDAERIRNGSEPLWSQKMKDGFTKGD